ncbi:MAG TPA: NAD(P)/FAD-dependent oxidoreductase, partial [Rubrivivax sp.]|nr:NAD(P)/FAD-dependent oxidoreductase [Rubrivivax sp.]
MNDAFDAVVVGAGPAGLVGATYLARFKRSVLTIDSGSSRALRIPRSHNVPGFPGGVAGSELVASMRQQAEHHGMQFAAGHVDTLAPDGDGWTLRWPGGQARARTVLLATGANDIEPAMPKLSEALRNGALRYCPVCDGYEVIGQSVGVVSDGPSGVKEAIYLRHFTDRVTLFLTDPEKVLDSSAQAELAAAGVQWAPGQLESMALVDDRVLITHDGRQQVCDSVYSAFGMQVHSILAVKAGAKTNEDGYLETDGHQQTTLPRVYAAGDVASGLNQISVASGGA